MVNAVAIRSNTGAGPPLSSVSSMIATMAAAPPPTPLNKATNCGIWVICTRYAPSTPMAVPAAMAARIGSRCWISEARKTITHANKAPAAPIRLPRRAVLGEDKPLRAMMKQTAATR